MPVITFHPSGKTIEVAPGTSLFDAALRAGLPVASSCGAEAVCGKCHMQILAGGENLSPPRAIEAKLLAKEGNPLTNRISCQTRVQGNCTVTTTYW